jgi:uncharacterized protein YsxB (DUF464 family)
VISVIIELFPDGCLKALHARGHAATAKKGSDLLCAAFSALLRTALNVLDREKRLIVKGDVENEGRAELALESCPDDTTAWLKGVTDFLLTGLFDLMAGYPQNLSISFKHSKPEGYNGT